MILPFSQKFKNGEATHFLEKIWKNEELWTEEEAIEFSNKAGSLGFDDWFLETVKPKIHTIRADAKNRWKAGMKIHAVFNNRTKDMYQFCPTFVCTGVQTIEIKSMGVNRYVKIDGKLISWVKLKILASNDGFENVSDFFEYFYVDFKGKIIHFTDFRY